jgi:Mlc titration factor MtfA (ptsG expression regulator)
MMQPLPQEWDAIVHRRVSYYRLLPADNQEDLQGLIQVFLDEKPFEGCGGLEVTDEIRVTIAGYACILLLGGQSDLYPKLRTILVYPHAYLAPHSGHYPEGTVAEGLQQRIGESWSFGNIVLSWDDVRRDAAIPQEGRNVVFHEFAHQLDAESGSAQGAPILPANARYADWARVLGNEYEALVNSAEHGRRSLLDIYGATSPAEFFAVATECFFLKPKDLELQHPELYSQMKLYYRQDPARYRF